MPGLDRTGPERKGPKTGRGLGLCGNDTSQTNRKGLGLRRGLGRGVGRRLGRGLRRGLRRGQTN